MAIVTTGFLSTTINGMTVNKSYPCNSKNYTNKASRDVKYVVIHYTGNEKDTAVNNCKYFQTAGRSASAHFFVDENSIYQSVELRDSAWHCGSALGYKTACRNLNSFGIEMCTSGNYMVSEKTQINAAYVCAYLCNLIGITAATVDTYVLRHYDTVRSNKKCPAQFVNDPDQWTNFKTQVKNILSTGKHDATIKRTYLMKGDTGAEVKELQTNLNYVGYNCGTPDGVYGSKTESAVKKFQKAHKLNVDGKFGNASKKKMQELVATKKAAEEQAKKKTGYDLIFDATYYASHNADVKKAYGTNKTLLLNHFKNHGMAEGRVACADFNVRVYKEKNADLQKAFGNDYKKYFEHYMTYGYKEKRTVV